MTENCAEIYDARLDPKYASPYIDIDEQRTRVLPGGGEVPFRYVHGGFEGTKAKFIFCLPDKEAYKGRFYQYLSPFPGPDEEVASLDRTGEDDTIAFCLKNGAYFVETNMESSSQFGTDKATNTAVWKCSAAAAEYSRTVAMEHYGCDRPYGYVFGGSGGGFKTMACIENTSAWDGACPFIIGTPYAIPYSIALHVNAMRTLRHKYAKIVDALDAGGSGDMYQDLNADEEAALREATYMGFPPQTWFVEAAGRIDDGSLPVLIPLMKAKDPAYFEDFWRLPGYEGTNLNSSEYKDRIYHKSNIAHINRPDMGQSDEYANGVDTAWKKQLADGRGAWITLETLPPNEDPYIHSVDVKILSGKAAGKVLVLDRMEDGRLYLGKAYGFADINEVLDILAPGDEVLMDNSDYIAAMAYYRHQIPKDPSFHAWDIFKDENGNAIPAQRGDVDWSMFTGTGTVQNGNIQGKVILTQALMDESTWPWSADWYRRKVEDAGNGDNFRLYYYDRCLHGDVSTLNNCMVINYLGGLHQALLDLSDWVERDVEPRQTTVYKMEGCHVIPENEAKKRHGLQPIVRLTANGSDCAKVKVGETVRLEAIAQVPDGAGKVTSLSFATNDPLFGTYAQRIEGDSFEEFIAKAQVEKTPAPLQRFVAVDGIQSGRACMQTCYDKPGTYFTTVFVTSQRDGDETEPFTQVRNLARARVIVE